MPSLEVVHCAASSSGGGVARRQGRAGAGAAGPAGASRDARRGGRARRGLHAAGAEQEGERDRRAAASPRPPEQLLPAPELGGHPPGRRAPGQVAARQAPLRVEAAQHAPVEPTVEPAPLRHRQAGELPCPPPTRRRRPCPPPRGPRGTGRPAPPATRPRRWRAPRPPQRRAHPVRLEPRGLDRAGERLERLAPASAGAPSSGRLSSWRSRL